MSIPPLDLSRVSSNLAQFKSQALASLFERAAPTNAPTNASSFSSVLDQFNAAPETTALPTSTKPTGLDASQAFSKPGQNVVTVLNRVAVTFKAQFSELGELRKSLVQQRDAAQQLDALDARSSDADIKVALNNFVASYNAGVNRFAPDVAQGGILEGSWEAARARFATERDINYFLNGAEAGHKGGLATLGIDTDPATGLASINDAQLNTALANDKGGAVAAITDFAATFVASVADLNAPDHAQVSQMANLDRAVHWIDANQAAVQKEFGPGAAATPDDAFARAAAQYDKMARLIVQP